MELRPLQPERLALIANRVLPLLASLAADTEGQYLAWLRRLLNLKEAKFPLRSLGASQLTHGAAPSDGTALRLLVPLRTGHH